MCSNEHGYAIMQQICETDTSKYTYNICRYRYVSRCIVIAFRIVLSALHHALWPMSVKMPDKLCIIKLDCWVQIILIVFFYAGKQTYTNVCVCAYICTCIGEYVSSFVCVKFCISIMCAALCNIHTFTSSQSCISLSTICILHIRYA